jgi:hypothetical protein
MLPSHEDSAQDLCMSMRKLSLPQQQRSIQSTLGKQRELKQRIFRHNRALLATIQCIERDRTIIVGIQETIDRIYERIRADRGRMSADDVTIVKAEESRRKSWVLLNEDKKQGCRRLIGLMDQLGQELLEITVMPEKSKNVGGAKLYLEVPREQRLAVGAPVREVRMPVSRPPAPTWNFEV